MKPVIVFGGYGVFGSQVCKELVRRGIPVTVAGRDKMRAESFARDLGPGCQGKEANATSRASCRIALAGQAVAVNCAGPFQRLDAALLEACLEAGCHYADITDDRSYAALVRAHGNRFQRQGLSAIYGCSSLPGISGALALHLMPGAPGWVEPTGDGTRSVPATLHLMAGAPGQVKRARVTLFIGNKNPKGMAAVRSLLAGLGRPIQAPQGTVKGFQDREVVPLPAPFGPRGVFNFDSPDYDLLPALVGAPSVSVKVGFELRLATYSFAMMARFGPGFWSGMAPWLDLPGRLLGGFGSSGGAVMTELFFEDGSVRRAVLLAKEDGQRMAALPCALAVRALLENPARGAMTVYELLGAELLLSGLLEAGFELWSTRPIN